MPQAVVVPRGTPAVRALLIALLVTAVVLGAIALIVWAWPSSDEGVTSTSASFGAYAPGAPPVMGDVHFTPPMLVPAATFGTYVPGSPPVLRDPQARASG